ncbi:hypothetical protein BDZ97DRAFT_1927377 [Flammula alnicola]|nr:hypothetical protein BDZ97DRAFT_1927377 [Flammula alnicola]
MFISLKYQSFLNSLNLNPVGLGHPHLSRRPPHRLFMPLLAQKPLHPATNPDTDPHFNDDSGERFGTFGHERTPSLSDLSLDRIRGYSEVHNPVDILTITKTSLPCSTVYLRQHNISKWPLNFIDHSSNQLLMEMDPLNMLRLSRVQLNLIREQGTNTIRFMDDRMSTVGLEMGNQGGPDERMDG